MFIGIDPGKLGGLAVLDERGCVVLVSKMPDSERGVWDLIAPLGRVTGARAALEFVRSRPKQGAPATFTFGWGYGGLRMALVGNAIPFVDVVPKKWQSAMSCLTKGDKKITRAHAEQLFPRVKVTHFVADALLIAEYLRRVETGQVRR